MTGRNTSRRIGAFWTHRPTKEGEPYFRGSLDLGRARIVVFRNTREERRNRPDYNIALLNPMPKPKPKGERMARR